MVQLWVDELCALREHELSEHLQRQAGLLHGGGNRGSLEVATVVDHTGRRVDQRVVSRRVEFDFELLG